MNTARKKNGTLIITRIIIIAVIASGGISTPKNGRIGMGNMATNHNIPKPANLFHLLRNRLMTKVRTNLHLSISIILIAQLLFWQSKL